MREREREKEREESEWNAFRQIAGTGSKSDGWSRENGAWIQGER